MGDASVVVISSESSNDDSLPENLEVFKSSSPSTKLTHCYKLTSSSATVQASTSGSVELPFKQSHIQTHSISSESDSTAEDDDLLDCAWNKGISTIGTTNLNTEHKYQSTENGRRKSSSLNTERLNLKMVHSSCTNQDFSLPENLKLCTNSTPRSSPVQCHKLTPASANEESISGSVKMTFHRRTHSISSKSDSTVEDDDLLDFAWNKGTSTIAASTRLDTEFKCPSNTENGHLELFSADTGSVNRGMVNSSSTNQDSERLTHVLSDSEDDTPNSYHGNNNNGEDATANRGSLPTSSQSITHTHSDSSDSQGESIPTLLPKKGGKCSVTNRKRKNSEPGLTLTKKELAEKRRQEVKSEKERKKMDLAHAKALKQASSNMKKVYKLEECLKYVTAVLDHNLFKENFGGDLKSLLQQMELKYQTSNQIYPMTITWKRDIPVDGGATKTNEESHVVLVMPSDRAVDLVLQSGLCTEIQAAQAHFTDMKLSLILHGTEQYLRPRKKGAPKDASRITREDLTEALVEVQILTGCTHRFAESSMEIATLIAQFSKAVAEIPYRLEKSMKEKNKLDWFGDGDNRDCVRVDKNGLGLQRLWRQQLCEFNLAGLQISEAITAVYQTPQALFQAYDACCSQGEAEKLLQDIPIRRNVGALSSSRKIGPELSKKIHAFFNSLDGTGDVSMSQD